MKIVIEKGKLTITEDDVLMASIAEVQAGIADLKATGQAAEDGLDQLFVQMQALRDQVAAGGAATAQDLDALMAQLADAKQPLTDMVSKERA